MKSKLRLLPRLAAATTAVWLAAISSVVAQAPPPLPTDTILDHDQPTPARRACFEFLKSAGKRSEEVPNLSGRNMCLYARKFGYQGKVE